MNSVVGALIEAWEELKINRGRVILSLIGVGAAVWAMATVIALGSILSKTDEHYRAIWDGLPGTVSVMAHSSTTPDDPYASPGIPQVQVDDNGHPIDEFGQAALRTVELVHSNIWSRKIEVQENIQAPGSVDCDPSDNTCYDTTPKLLGVDDGYFDIFTHTLLYGRLINASDGDLQMNPVVVNESTWQRLGTPAIEAYPRLRLSRSPSTSFTIVGVVKNNFAWDDPTILMPYKTALLSIPPEILSNSQSQQLYVMAPRGLQEQAVTVLEATLGAQLGESWNVYSAYSAERNEGQEQIAQTITLVVGLIGAIVILLGALGLLTVSIVTVRQRIREVGIRRAMGASGKRIFFAVFLESVVATTFAGFIGVVLSIFTIRLAPFDLMNLPVSNPAYPFTAAFLGVLISAGVGALAGIIPASIAVKIKPIDAIRY